MYPDARTLPNPTLTFAGLGCLFRGLGMSADERGSVTKACRKLSNRNGRGTTSTSFSPYNPGAAPSLDAFERLLGDPDSQVHHILTRREVRHCREFIAKRRAVGVGMHIPEQARRTHRPALHSFGSLRSNDRISRPRFQSNWGSSSRW